MRKYLNTLHQRSDQHKRRFAFLISSVVTLFIFSIWFMASFGNGGTLADKGRESGGEEEVSPLQSLRMNISSSLGALKGSLEDLRDQTETYVR